MWNRNKRALEVSGLGGKRRQGRGTALWEGVEGEVKGCGKCQGQIFRKDMERA